MKFGKFIGLDTFWVLNDEMNSEDFASALQVSPKRPYRVLIASANPLFREGLRKVYAARWEGRAEIVGTSTMQEALETLERLRPDLVIVDYDDTSIHRQEFLDRFLQGETTMQVVLVSLDAVEPVVLYQRKRLTAEQAETWLFNPWIDAYS